MGFVSPLVSPARKLASHPPSLFSPFSRETLPPQSSTDFLTHTLRLYRRVEPEVLEGFYDSETQAHCFFFLSPISFRLLSVIRTTLNPPRSLRRIAAYHLPSSSRSPHFSPQNLLILDKSHQRILYSESPEETASRMARELRPYLKGVRFSWLDRSTRGGKT
jgi:hypothetical protein